MSQHTLQVSCDARVFHAQHKDSPTNTCVLCVNITREVKPGLICKEGDIKNINILRLNKICKPFTVTDSFVMIRRFQFLHRCYFVREEVHFFSDRFMRCFSCANFRNDFDGLRSIETEMSTNFLSLHLDGLPLRSASNTEPVSRNFSLSLRTALQ
jgi:hypothetical protein